MYPNPVIEQLNISYTANKIDLLNITDLSGRVIMSEQDFIKQSINVTSSAEGVYFLQATVNGETTIHKFVKKSV